MKKMFYLFVFVLPLFVYSQSITVEQAEKSNDPKLIASFVKDNPTNPKTPELRRRLLVLLGGGTSSSGTSTSTKTTTLNSQSYGSNSSVKASNIKQVSDKNKKTADLLNHILNGSSNSNEAYVEIVNNSKCNIAVKITGGKNYTINIPARSKNVAAVEKGSYALSSLVCDANYRTTKNITNDISISLNSN